MGFLDRLMDALTRRGTKLVASGHPPADAEPETGSGEISTELQSDFGSDTPAAVPPADPPADSQASTSSDADA